MAVNYRTIDLPFGGGIDSKTAQQIANVPKMSQVVNMRFFESGAYSRRESYTPIAQPSGTINRIAEYGGAALALTSTGLSRYIEGQWRSATTEGPRPVGVSRSPIVRTDEGANDAFSATADGLTASAWTRRGINDNDVWFQIVDADNGALIYGPVTVTGYEGDTHPDVTGLDVFPIYDSGGVLFFVVLGKSNSFTYPVTTAYQVVGRTVTNVTQSSLTSPPMLSDGCLVEALDGDSSAYLLAYNTSTTVYVLARLRISGLACTIESSANITGVTGTPSAAVGIVINPGAGKVFAYFQGSGPTLDYASRNYNATLTGPVAVSTLYTPGAAPSPSIPFYAAYGAARSDGSMVLFTETRAIVGGGEPNSAPCVKWFELSSTGAMVASANRVVWSTQLLARPFVYDSRVFCPTVTANLIPAGAVGAGSGREPLGSGNTWVMNAAAHLLEVASAADTSGRRAAEFLVDVARRPGYVGQPFSQLARVSRTSLVEAAGTVYSFAAPTDTIDPATYATRFLSSPFPFSNTADEVKIDMAPRPSGVAYSNGALLLAGGYVSQSDGERHAEVMQCPAPTIAWSATTSFGPDFPLSGTVAWCFVWAWRDRLGNVHRSSPSTKLVVDLDNVLYDDPGEKRELKLRVGIPPFFDVAADDGTHPTDVTLEAYVSPGVTPDATAVAVDDVYKRSISLEAFDDSAETTLLFSGNLRGIALDDLRDPLRPWESRHLSVADITGLFPLYTNGGVLPHDPIPHALHIVSSRDRVWIIDSEDRYRALHSAPVVPTQAPAFSQEFFVRVPTEAGELTALGVIGDSLVLLSESSIHMLETIEGPDSTGAGAFPPLREISREVGCINRASVVSTDVGLFFQSDAGFYLLDTSGGLTHVGRDIQPTTEGADIVGADVLPEGRQVRFTTASGYCFVFDYEVAQWSTYALLTALTATGGTSIVASARVGGEHVLADDQGYMLLGDNVTEERVLHGVTTHWVKLAGLQGFKRIRKIGVLGRIELPSGFTPSDDGDLFGSIVMTVAYDYDGADVDTYTVDVGDLYAADQLDPLHLRFHIARQKCAAIKIGVWYVPQAPAETVGQPGFPVCSLSISGLALEVGIKPGIRKIGHAGGVSVS